MANAKISALTDGNPAQSGDEIPIARGGANYKITAGSIASLSGNGDVVGPASATDNAVARFDGTTGKLIQNSAITIEDDGSMVIPANSTNAGLRITQTGSGNALLVEDSANPDSTPVVIDASGNVLKGITSVDTTTPLASGTGVMISSNGTSTSSITQLTWNTGFSVAPYIQLGKSNSATVGTRGQVTSGQLLYRIAALGDDGTNFINAAFIDAAVDGTPGTNDMPGRLIFSTTADGASTPTERMRIDNAGRVWVACSSFSAYGAPLNVQNRANDTEAVRIGNYSGSGSEAGKTGIGFSAALASSFQYPHAYIGVEEAALSSYNASLVFKTRGSSADDAPTERMRIDSAGNVGIGTTPSATTSLRLGKNITGGTSAYGVYQEAQVQSATVTNVAYGFQNVASVSAGGSLSEYRHFDSFQGTLGITPTNQYSFYVNSNLTGATNNYGFYSNIASGSGRWNFYANGTAANYFAGDMQLDKTVTATGTTGAQTINKNAGTVNFAAAATSLVVTDSRVTANSIIICTVGTDDTTMKSVAAVAGAGSFTLHANAAATAETRVNFLIIN